MDKLDTVSWNPYPIRCLTSSGPLLDGGSYPPRTTRWYELEYIQEGSGSIITAGEELPAVKGRLFLRPPGLPVQGRLPYRSILIIFDLCYDPARLPLYGEKEFLDGGGDAGKPLLSAAYLATRSTEPVRDWFDAFGDAYLSSSANRWLTMKTLLFQLLGYVTSSDAGGAPLPRSVALHAGELTALQNYIRSHISEPFSLGQAAALCGLSEGFLCRIFRRMNGISLVEYVNETKIGYAKRLLSETNLPIKAIAAAAGFQTETYFYTLFKRIEGVTPTRFREMHRYP